MVTTCLNIKRQTVTPGWCEVPPSSAFPRARASSISPDANRLVAIEKKNDRYLIRSRLRPATTNASRQHDDRHERKIVPRPQQIGSWTGERPLPTLTLAGTWFVVHRGCPPFITRCHIAVPAGTHCNDALFVPVGMHESPVLVMLLGNIRNYSGQAFNPFDARRIIYSFEHRSSFWMFDQTRKNLLLTGRPGVGKTTIMIRLAEVLGGRADGFHTQELREGEGERGSY